MCLLLMLIKSWKKIGTEIDYEENSEKNDAEYWWSKTFWK